MRSNQISSRPRYLWVAAGFLGAASVMAVRRYLDAKRSEELGANRSKDPKASADVDSGAGAGDVDGPHAQPSDGSQPMVEEVRRSTPADGTESPGKSEGVPHPESGLRELAEFLAGDSWYDENSWSGIWEREGIEDAAAWLRARGSEVLRTQRERLMEHPALLAGCRRRWIVVCRYAGIDVSEAAQTWNDVEPTPER